MPDFRRTGAPDSSCSEIMFPEDVHRLVLAEDGSLCDDALGDVFFVGKVEHDVFHDALHDCAEAAGAGVLAHGDAGDLAEGFGLEDEVDAVGLHELLVLSDQGVFGFGQDSDKCFFVELVEGDEDGKPADKFGGQAEFDEVLRCEVTELFREGFLCFGIEGRAEAEGVLAGRIGKEFLDSGKSTAADEENVARIELDALLVGVLAAALGRDGCHGALEYLEEGLLDAFAGHVAREGRVLAFAGDLVDLVDVDDAALSFLDVVVGRLEQPDEDVFDVFADVAGFGEGRRVGDRKRNAEGLGQRLDEVGLARAGRADHQNIALLKLDIRIGHAVDALVVVVDGHGDRFFGAVLADNVLVEELDDLAGLLHVFVLDEAAQGPLLIGLLEAGQDVIGRSDAVFADDGAAASDEALAGRLGFAAEQALRFSFCHFRLLSIVVCRRGRVR